MAASQYPGNSNKDKAKINVPEPKKLEQIVSSGATQQKPSLSRRIREQFSGDDAHGVGGYVLFEVLIPAAKTTIAEAVSQGIERLLFGEVRARSSSSRGPHISYNQMSRSSSSNNSRTVTPRSREVHDFGDILIENRGEAEEVLERLFGLTQEYQVATVADLYALVGITGHFTDEKWGWTDLRNARARPVRNGYVLDLPRPVPID